MKCLLLSLLAALTLSQIVPTSSPAGATEVGPRWASFGDSYAAGEGLEHPSREDYVTVEGDVVKGSGDTARSCQRALAEDDAEHPSVAWGAGLANAMHAEPFTFVACTGAITDDLFPNPTGRLQAGQLEQARFFTGRDQFDVVTLSIGGNNVAFAEIISSCIGMSSEGADAALNGAQVGGKAAGLPGALVSGIGTWAAAPWVGCDLSENQMKDRIDALTGAGTLDHQTDCKNLGDSSSRTGHWDDDGITVGLISLPELYDVIGRCVAPHGTIIVMGYPQLVDETRFWSRIEGNRCHRIRRADIQPLRGATAHLNYRISQAVERARETTGANFQFVDPNRTWEGVERDDRHALCGPGEDWLNGITIGGEGDGAFRKERSFHPNQLGHNAMLALADAVELKYSDDPDAGIATRGPTIYYGSPGSSAYEEGIEVTSLVTVERLAGAPDDFKEFLIKQLGRLKNESGMPISCKPQPWVRVNTLHLSGFAYASFGVRANRTSGECDGEGTQVIWARRGDTWSEVAGGQGSFSCSDLTAALVPSDIVPHRMCDDEDYVTVPYNAP